MTDNIQLSLPCMPESNPPSVQPRTQQGAPWGMRRGFILTVLVFLALCLPGWAAPLVEDTFSSATGNLVGTTPAVGGTWTAVNTATDKIQVSSGSLAAPTGLLPSVGNKVSWSGSGEDASVSFTSQNSGTVYYAVLLNLATVPNTTGVNLISLGSSTTALAASLAIRRDTLDTTKYNIGFFSRQTTNGPLFSSVQLAANTTHFVVISYTFVAGTGNDIIKLWLDPSSASFGGTEPTPTLTLTNASGDITSLNQLYLWQRDSQTPTMDIDELVVATTWAEVTPPDGPVAQAEIRAEAIRQNFNTALWPGYQGQAFATDNLATSSTQLASLFAALPNAQSGVWHRIRLSPTGDWSNASKTIISLKGSPSTNSSAATYGSGGNRDYSVGGGGVLIEPDSGTVNIESQFRASGVRGLHVRNITFARTARNYALIAPGGTYPMPLEEWSPNDTPSNWTPRDETTVLVDRTTAIDANIRNPELSIAIFENCKIGTGFHPTDADNSLAYCTGFRSAGGADQISLINCQFKGLQTGISTSSIRWFKMHRNEFQLVIGDASIALNTAGSTGYAPFGTIFPDKVMNVWRRLNTVRNMVDECAKVNSQGEDMAFWAEHSDAWQLGTGGDTGGYNALSEYNVAYMERSSYYDVDDTGTGLKRETGGTQGSYNDDSHYPIDIVTLNEIHANNTGNCFVNWNGGDSLLVKSIAARAASLAPSAVAGVNATFNFTIDPIAYVNSGKYSGFTPSSNITVASSVYDMFGGSTGTVTDGGNNTQARWRKNTSPTAASMLNGTFTTDAQGRTAYTFADTGTEPLATFKRNLWLQLKPKTGSGGPDDPANWPAN